MRSIRSPGLRRIAMREVAAALLCAAALAGCAAAAPPPLSGPPAPRAFDPVGSWEGTLKAGCLHFRPLMVNTRCGAVNHIALTIIDEPSGIDGFYKCSFGTMDCFNQNESGTFAYAAMKGTHLALRIAMQDGSSCLFDGDPVGANRIDGYYACYQGGGLEERGSFEIARRF
jgi:hypothetical protein